MITVLVLRTLEGDRMHYEVLVETEAGLWRRRWRTVGESDQVCPKLAAEQEAAAARLLSPAWEATWKLARKPFPKPNGWNGGRRNPFSRIW